MAHDCRVAGVVLVRQRPGNGNVVFCTIEDETGIANIVVWSSLLDRFRRAVLGSSLLQVTGPPAAQPGRHHPCHRRPAG